MSLMHKDVFNQIVICWVGINRKRGGDAELSWRPALPSFPWGFVSLSRRQCFSRRKENRENNSRQCLQGRIGERFGQFVPYSWQIKKYTSQKKKRNTRIFAVFFQWSVHWTIVLIDDITMSLSSS